MVALAPAVCPTCSTAIPAGRAQCPGCRKVFGEDNRCETCNAVAGVFARGGGYVCAACSAPRQCLPGTLVLGGDRPSSAVIGPRVTAGRVSTVPATATASRVSATGLRLLGGAAMGGGVFAGVLAVLLFGGPFGWVAGGAIGVAGLAVGLLAWRAGAAQNASAAAEERTAREHAVLALAEQRGGVLTVTEVAQTLGWSAVAADALLTAMADGTRVTVEVDDEGLLSWHFHELARGAVARVRVADEGVSALEARATESADAKLLGREPKP